MIGNVRVGLVVGMFTTVVVLTACSDDDPGVTPPMPPGNGENGAVEGDVAVDDNVFDPQSFEVEVGGTVTWGWQGSNPHDVTWDEADLPNSDTQSEGSHEVTAPSEPGEYGYHCTVHGSPGAGMHGTLVVTE